MTVLCTNNSRFLTSAQLLEVLDLNGCIVTADAMSCQKAITSKIAEKQADYVLGLKENQPNLKRDAEEFFDDVLNTPNCPSIQHIHTIDKGHGRTESRDYYLATDTSWMLYKEGWTALNSVGTVVSTVSNGENVTKERRYYIPFLTD